MSDQEPDGIDAYIVKEKSSAVYATIIEKEIQQENKIGEENKQKERYMWVATNKSITNFLDVFGLEAVDFGDYVDRENKLHIDVLYRERGNSNSYMLVKTIYDPFVLKFSSAEKEVKELERGMKVIEIKIADKKLSEVEQKDNEIILSGFRIHSIESIGPDGVLDRLTGPNGVLDESQLATFKNMLEILEDNPLKDLKKFAQDLSDSIAEYNLNQKERYNHVKHVYG